MIEEHSEKVRMKKGERQDRMQVCVYVCVLSEGGKKQEERTGEELLMALLLSLSAHCDSQNQLLTKTTSLWRGRRRKCSGEVMSESR